MLNVLKRRKADSPLPAQQELFERRMQPTQQQRQLRSNAGGGSPRSIGSHAQHQRGATSGRYPSERRHTYPTRSEWQAHSRHQQQHSRQIAPHRIAGVHGQRASGAFAPQPHEGAKRHSSHLQHRRQTQQEQLQQQTQTAFPVQSQAMPLHSSMTVRATSAAMPASLPPHSTAFTTPVVSANDAVSSLPVWLAAVGSPPSLPKISTMLRLPTGGAAAEARLRALSTNNMFSVGSTWTAEMSSRNPSTATGNSTASSSSGMHHRSAESPTFANEVPSPEVSPKVWIDPGHCSASATNELSTAPLPSDARKQRIANPNKDSRYLREMDRREILSRLEQGEKQATLAKEYQVSRAAISNLYKHREDVLQRKDEHPFAKHPKKSRPKSLKISTRAGDEKVSIVNASRVLPSPRCLGSARDSTTHEVKTRAAALLLTSLRNKNTTTAEFQRSSDRLVRLVLEEALALVPIKSVEVHLSDAVKAIGMGWQHPPCAISMEVQPPYLSEQDRSVQARSSSSPLLDQFRYMEPNQPTARACVTTKYKRQPQSGVDVEHMMTKSILAHQVSLVDTRSLPASLQHHNVFLFDVSATSADAICAVVERLQERGAVEAMISLVVLFVDSEVVRSVHAAYPRVTIVAAQINPSGKVPSPSPLSSPTTPAGAYGELKADAEGSPKRSPCVLSPVLSRFRQVSMNSTDALDA